MLKERRKQMAKIKTRELQKRTIKSLNKSEIVTDKMKKTYAKTKTSMDAQVKETTEKNEQSNQTNYATDKTMRAAKSSFVKSKKHAVRGIKETQRRVKVSKANRNEVRRTVIKSSSIKSNSYNTAMKKQAEKKMATKMQEGSKKLAKSAAKNVKRTARLTLKAAKVAIASAKALIAIIVSAGWISVIVIIIYSSNAPIVNCPEVYPSASEIPILGRLSSIFEVILNFITRRAIIIIIIEKAASTAINKLTKMELPFFMSV